VDKKKQKNFIHSLPLAWLPGRLGVIWIVMEAMFLHIGGIMATLNVKNIPDALYERLKSRAQMERRSVAQEVTMLLAAALDAPAPLSIMDLDGLGRDLWQGVDAARHVEAERAAWD
jgi:plasmid stability protein